MRRIVFEHVASPLGALDTFLESETLTSNQHDFRLLLPLPHTTRTAL